MNSSQMLIAFHAVRHHPGQTLEELSRTVYEKYHGYEAVRCMMSGHEDSWLLKGRLEQITCVVIRDGRYYYDSSIQPLAKDPIDSCLLKYQLDAEAEKLRKELKTKPDGD